MNSHVQIPKSFLKNFSYKPRDKGRVVDYLDLKKKEILCENIKTLGTITGFYSDECEEFLDKNIEDPVNKIIEKIKPFGRNTIQQVSIGPEEIKVIFDFFNYSFSRSKYAVNQANTYCITSAIQPVTNEELIWLQKHNIFNEYCLRVLINRTDINFVIPRNCFYIKTSSYLDKPYIILPFSKKYAIILISKQEDATQKEDDNEHLFIDDKVDIHKLNENALWFEKLMNNEFIVGDKKELSRLKVLL